jgi:hypothetical protein
MKTTKAQHLKKLELLVEQARKHCEKHNLQYFTFHEAPEHQVALSQNCTEELLTNVAAHLGLNHPQAVVRAREIIARVVGAQKAKEAESGSLVLGLDGKPMAEA